MTPVEPDSKMRRRLPLRGTAGWPGAADDVEEDNTVREAMRYPMNAAQLAEVERTVARAREACGRDLFAPGRAAAHAALNARRRRAQADEKDEHAKLRAYLERGQALAAAGGAVARSPLRGSAGWYDSDAQPCVAAPFGASGLAVYAGTEPGTRSATRPNQDAFGIALGLAGRDLVLTMVLDGHGPQGHFIARHVRDRLPAWIGACAADSPADAALPPPAMPSWVLRASGVFTLHEQEGLQRVRGGGMPPGAPAWAPAVARAFIELDGDLCSGRSSLLSASRVSPEQSGCTAVCALVGQGVAVVAACGDSAAFLAQEVTRGSGLGAEDEVAPGLARPLYAARQLTRPHKPAGAEAERVKLAGGRVSAAPGEENIPRVWPREADLQPGRMPHGLAVARAFGDQHWKSAGVCAAPDVLVRTLAPADAFLVLCSDGVTDSISGAAAVSIAANALHAAGDTQNAAQAVIEAAKAAWAALYPRQKRDDITAAVVLLRKLAPAPAAVLA